MKSEESRESHRTKSQFFVLRVTGLFSFNRPTYLIRDPKLAKKLAVKDFDYFMDDRIVLNENVNKLFGKSLIGLTGQKWRGKFFKWLISNLVCSNQDSCRNVSDMRTTLSPAFTGSKMRQMYEFVAKVGQQSADTIKDQIKAKGDNVFEFKELATRFTVDVIATSAFGIEVNSFKDPDNDFQKIAQRVTNFGNFSSVIKVIGYLTIPRIMKFFKVSFFGQYVDDFFDKAVIEMMRIREEKGIVRHDMINLLMQAKKGYLTHQSKEEENISEGFATVEEVQAGQKQVKTQWDDDDIAAQ
jgi:cytochrome P450 family 9